MSKVVHLDEIRLAKQIVSEIPDALKALDKAYELVYNYKHYDDIARIINEMIDSKIMLELHLSAYKAFLTDHGVKIE